LRNPGNWTDGQSARLFTEFVDLQGGRVRSVDIDVDACEAAQGHISSPNFSVTQSDSVTWLTQQTDLDQVDLRDIFVGEQYDCIVCADVLEHLKSPERVLEQCRHLLKPGGRLLTSVPNAAYCGLLAELLLGEFRYRDEGLLDRTHLRFGQDIRLND
jgi:2-polyprenyl-3-methyl-5-hydroxy-6-metoxy-1,4-benzoquinol methylase